MKREKITQEIAAKMKEIAPWATTILYGSEARGEARSDSDIDILIIVPDEFSPEYNKIRTLIFDEMYAIELKNDVLISTLVLLQRMWTERKTPFTCNIETDGIVL